MWNSSRRIALFSTSLVLLGAGLFGAAWLAHWLPIEIGEAETGDLATRQTLEELDALDWSSFTNPDNIDAGDAASPFVHSQSEPDVATARHKSQFADTGEFVDRNRFLDNGYSEPDNASRLSQSGEVLTSHSIPDEFPASDFRNNRQQNLAGSTANRSMLSTEFGQAGSQQHNVQQISGTASSGFGAAAGGRSVQSIPAGDSGSAPPNLFDAEESPTFGEARAFPTEVAFAERAATLDLFEPEQSEPNETPPPFENDSSSRSGQTKDAT